MADDPSSVAHNPAAPASERFDATSELSRIYRPTASSIVPAHDMVEVIGMVQEHYAAVDMAKAAAA
jgi:hypothetical protein